MTSKRTTLRSLRTYAPVLLEAPFNPAKRQRNSVLLTIDLTKAVADEAIARRDSVVIAYHPIIFRGLKSITMADTQQTSLLRLAAEGISVIPLLPRNDPISQ
jgi:hypothetical protein